MKRLALIGLSMFVKAGLNFAALIIFARILTPAEYGVYSLVMTLVMLADAFAFMWLRQSYTRFFAETDRKRHQANISHILLMYIGLSVACIVLASFGGLVYPVAGLSPALWVVVGGMMVGEGLFNLQLAHANNGRREKRFLALSAIKALSALGLGWWMVTLGYGISGILLAQLAAYILTAAPLLAAGKRIRQYLIWRPETTVVKFLLSFGLPLAVMGTLESTITAAQRNLVFHMLGAESLGVYSVSSDLVQKILIFLMLTLNVAMLPVVVKALETSGAEAARRKLKENAVVLFGMAVPAAVGMGLLAPQICEVFLGSQYRDTASVLLPWFILSALAKCAVSYYLVLSFYLTKSNSKLILPMVGVTILSIASCYFGIQQFGIYGALGVNILTWVVYAVLVWWLGRSRFALPAPWGDWSRITVAAAVMALAIWPFHAMHGIVGLGLSAIVGGTVYLALVILFNVSNCRQWIHLPLKWL